MAVGAPTRADWLLLAAALVAGIGYTEGASLARIFGGRQVICWALLVALLLGERLDAATWLCAAAVVVCPLIGNGTALRFAVSLRRPRMEVP